MPTIKNIRNKTLLQISVILISRPMKLSKVSVILVMFDKITTSKISFNIIQARKNYFY